MNQDRKLFVFDVDGTLVTSENKMLDQTVKALKIAKKRGHIIAIATGRPLVFIKHIKKTKIFDYLICNNGSYYFDQNSGKKYLENTLSQEVVFKMIDMAKQNDSIILVNDWHNVVCAIFGHNQAIKKEFKKQWKKRIKIVDSKSIFDHIDKNSITQSSILSIPHKIQMMEKELVKIYNKIEIKIANWKYLDANPQHISKYTTIKTIANANQIPNHSIVTFGDSGNDIEMLEKAGMGIAMGNGTKEAKAVANEIIGNNNSPVIANKILEIIK